LPLVGGAEPAMPRRMDGSVRHDWKQGEVRTIHDLPLFELIDRARKVHLDNHPALEVQLCSLLSVKTGGCPEDCSYCPQSKHFDTGVSGEKLLTVADVVAAAGKAQHAGATRFCMGAAWREVRDASPFDRVLDMIRGVKALGMEACVTLGMLTPQQARRLKEAGLDSYNHNLDTSREFYPSIVTTRTYDDRLATLRAVRDAGISVCTGGIIGLGETLDDRCAMLVELSTLDPHPESVPINALVRVPGTPLASYPPVDPLDLVRMIATARILMPKSRVRLSAGRSELGRDAQLLCLYAGANSLFYGDKLLTTPNADASDDDALLGSAGLVGMGS
jgi:biotin synthase